MEKNPRENEAAFRKRLVTALEAYQNGVRCSCGNDIWVIGSAVVGNSCFTCITGEAYPCEDFELDSAIRKKQSFDGPESIIYQDKPYLAGLFDDDGDEINPHQIPKPSLCITCLKDGDSREEILCNLTRYDQKDESEFRCFAYRKRS
ncbi:MAG: hypothetical protein H6581_00425 [Bacteroidia bacterium]|nr:hypothetical protein [Bacteroidia bacterium]